MSESDEVNAEMRGRCNTWPMQQFNAPTPFPHVPTPVQALALSETPSSSYQSINSITSISSSFCTGSLSHGLPSISVVGDNMWPNSSDPNLFPYNFGQPSTSMLQQNLQPQRKKRIRRRNPDSIPQKKPNPWGDDSYSDLIAKALESAPGGRMKLNEIYQWFSDNVTYFKERSSQEHAAGWKVFAGRFLFLFLCHRGN